MQFRRVKPRQLRLGAPVLSVRPACQVAEKDAEVELPAQANPATNFPPVEKLSEHGQLRIGAN